jgi:hypothetical protein
MSMPNFEGIFYPSDKSEFNSLLPPFSGDEKKGALVLMPHSSLSVVAPLISHSLTGLKEAKEILLLAPVHSQAPSGLFCTTEREFKGINGTVKLAAFDRLPANDSLFDKEYTVELSINAINRYFPDAVIYPVLCNLESKKEYTMLQSLIALRLADGFSVVMTGNLSAKGDGEKLRRDAKQLTEAVESKHPLLSLIREKRVTGCAAPLLEALTALPIKTGFELFKCGSSLTDTIDNNKGDGDIWYGSAIAK